VIVSCPNKCDATRLALYGDNPKRKVLLDVGAGVSGKVLHVISASKACLDNGFVEPPVEIVSAFMEGRCEQGKASVSPKSGLAGAYVRSEADKHCPSMLVKNGVTNIGMPGTEGGPLKFRAFCPDPPKGTIDSWGYLFSNVFMPSKAESNTYVIESKGCEGSYPLTATVKAYPQIKANIKVNITYNCVKKEDSVPKKGAAEVIRTERQGIKPNAETSTVVVHADNWEIGVALGGSVDSISLGSQLKVLQPSELLKGLRESVSIFLYLFDLIMLDSTENILNGKAKQRVDLMYGGKAIGDSVPDTDTTGLVWDRKSSTGTGKIGIRYPKIELALEYANTEINEST